MNQYSQIQYFKMVVDKQKRINTNTVAVSAFVATNATTAVTIVPANADRIFFRIENLSNNAIWVKLQASSIDNNKVGIFIDKLAQTDQNSWQMPVDNIYTGEISVIAQTGTPVINYTEY